jgi:DNA-binding MarR family transcriptional regulator
MRNRRSKLMTILKPQRDFADGLEITMTLPLIDALLLAASHPDKGVDDFARMAGVRPGTMSRWLQDLSDIDRRGKPGLGLVVRSQLYDRRSVASSWRQKGGLPLNRSPRRSVMMRGDLAGGAVAAQLGAIR